MHLCSLQLLWTQTTATVIACLLAAVLQVSSQDPTLTSATLKASMGNSHNATILFNNTTFTSFHTCLSKNDTWRCVVNIKYDGAPSYNYTAESAQTIGKTETDQTNYSGEYVCIIPGFYVLPDPPSAITCTRLDKSCSKSHKKQASWSVKLHNACKAELIWIDQEISFYTQPSSFIEKEENKGQCQNQCDNTCLRNTALQGIDSPTPAEEMKPSSEADANEDTSTNHAGTIAGVIFAVLIVAALIIIGVIFWKRRSGTLTSSKVVTTRGQERFPATSERSPAAFSNDSSSVSQMANGPKQGTHAYDTLNGDGGNHSGMGIGNRSPYETIKDHDNNNTVGGTSVYSEISATDGNKNDDSTGFVPVSGSNNTNLASCNRNSDGDTSQYTYIDGTDLHRNEYNRLGEETKIFAHPYNDLLNPKEDPKRRSPIPTPDASKQQTSSYSLAQPIVDGASGQSNRPTEVIDLAHPSTNEHPVKGKFKLTDKSANDYDYPSDEEKPKRKEQRYFELEKEEEDVAEPYTAGGENDRPYFELEKVDDSDTYYGSGYPNHGFDANE